MRKKITCIFITVMMMATVSASAVSLVVTAPLDPLIDAQGPYGTMNNPYYEGDTVDFSARILGGNSKDYMFRWDVNGDKIYDGPGPAPDFWGAFGETDYSHQYLDDHIGEAKVEAWDGISMIEEGIGGIWDGTVHEYDLHAGYYATHGLKFKVNKDTTIDQLGVYRHDHPFEYYNIRLWTDTGTMLAQALYITVPEYSWGWFSIPSVSVTAGESYIVSVGIRGDYQSGASNPGTPPDGTIEPLDRVYCMNNAWEFPSSSGGSGILPLVDVHFTSGNMVPDTIDDHADVWVENISPYVFNATATPNPQYEGYVVDFSTSFDDPGLDDSWEYRWDFGDGVVSNWTSGHSGQLRILLATTWRDSISDIYLELVKELGDFNCVIDLWDWGLGYDGIPTLDKLKSYDVIVVGQNYFVFENREPMGDVMADYSDAGGNVVFAWAAHNKNKGVLGRWVEEDYNCVPQSNLYFGTQRIGAVYDPSHPILDGVTDLSCYFSYSISTTIPDATRLCDLANGNVLVAYKDNPKGSGGRIVDFQMFPNPLSCTGDYMTLFANCMKWASQKSPGPWSMPLTTISVSHRYVDIVWNEKETMRDFQATVELRDDDLGNGFATTSVTILPHDPPVANAGGPFYSGFEGSPVTLDAGASMDPEGHSLLYRWDYDSDGFFDTNWLKDHLFNHTYNDDFKGNVTVEVTDGYYFDRTTAEVDIFNVAPEVSLLYYPDNPDVFVDFSGSVSDPGSDTYTYKWDFGDGNVIPGNLGMNHVYYESGLFTVELEVTDDDGGVGTAVTSVFVVGPEWTVDAGGTGHFLSIQEAVDAAQPKDLIAVKSGTYEENVEITKPLCIYGAGAGNTIVDGMGISHGFNLESNDISISRITVQNCSGPGINIGTGDINLDHMEIKDNDLGIDISNSSGPVNVQRSWIHNNENKGIYIENWGTDSDTVYIQCNRIEDNGPFGIHIENMSNTSSRMEIYGNRELNINTVSGSRSGIYGHVIGIFIHNSDKVKIMFNTIRGYSEFGILDYGNEDDRNWDNTISSNNIDGLNRRGAVGIVTQFVYERWIQGNKIINNGWWGLKSLYPSYIHVGCSNWNIFINNGHNLSINGEYPSKWPDPGQGNTSCGGAYYFDPPPGAEIPEFEFDGNIMINNAIGIMVEGATDKLILSNNTIRGNEIAILVESGDPVIENNRLTNNIEAIIVSSGAPVILGNIIDHNEVGIQIAMEANPRIGGNLLVHNDIDLIMPEPKEITSYLIDLMEDVKTGNKKMDRNVEKAIDYIQRSLNKDPKNPDSSWKKFPLWIDDSHLDPKHGHMVFNEIKKTVKILMKIVEDNDYSQDVSNASHFVIDKLITAVDLIAHTTFEEAQKYSGDKKLDQELQISASELINAENKFGKGHFDKAIDHYKKAWEYAQLAIKHES